MDLVRKYAKKSYALFDVTLILYNGVFGCHGNTCYVIFIGVVSCMIHIICPINVCTDFEINRYKIDEVRKYAKIVFYLTSHDAKTLRHVSWELRHSDRYFDQEHFETNQKSLRLPVQKCFGDLDLDL